MHLKSRKPIALMCLLVVLLGVGCKQGIQEQTFEIKAKPSAAERVQTLLRRYADGSPVSSEITQFPGFIADMAESDSENLGLIQQLYEDLQSNPENSTALASAALEKLVVPSGDTN